jgi:fumarate reductase subunit D
MNEKMNKDLPDVIVQEPSEHSRWTAALSYVGFLCFFSLWKSKNDPFVKYHARQGFLLLLGECIILVMTVILDLTIGRLRFIGVLIVGLIQLTAGLGALTLSVIGFVKALFGEYWHLPFFGEYRERIPGFHKEV